MLGGRKISFEREHPNGVRKKKKKQNPGPQIDQKKEHVYWRGKKKTTKGGWLKGGKRSEVGPKGLWGVREESEKK